MTLFVAPVVEGETEERCVKQILSRIWTEMLGVDNADPLAVLTPVRADRSALVKEDHPELAKKIEQAFRFIQKSIRVPDQDRGLILVLFDADEDCPASLGPRVVVRAKAVRSDIDIECVIAKRELENWFKAAAASLAGVNGLPQDLCTPPNPEHGSGDVWLTAQLQKLDRRRKYTKPADAVELAKRMNLADCRAHSLSFDKLCRVLEARTGASGSASHPAGPNTPSQGDIPTPRQTKRKER